MTDDQHEPEHEHEPDIPESVSVLMSRCSGCGNVHVTMLDAEEDPLCEMTLDDDDLIRIACQFLRSVFPNIDATSLAERVKSIGTPLQ